MLKMLLSGACGRMGRQVAMLAEEEQAQIKRKEREEKKRQEAENPVLTKEESRYYTWGAVKAALLVTGVMCAGIVLFVLFCLYIWFK